MKLKHIILSMIMFCMLMIVPMYANAEGTVDDSAASTVSGDCSATDGSSVKWNLTNGTLTISGKGRMYYDYNKASDVPWVDYKDEIQKIVVEEGVTFISSYAFYSHSNVTSIALPGTSLEMIGKSAFRGCTSLTSIVIPDSVTKLLQGALGGCTSLTDVTLGSSMEYIVEQAFVGCYSLTNIKIPSNVTYIGDRAFQSCSKLVSVDLSSASSLTLICENAFLSCSNLAEITIPETVIDIDDYAFRSCVGLKTIYFEGDVPTFGNNVFSNVTADAYYPADNETWTEDVLKDYGGTITWHARSGGDCSADGSNVTWNFNNGTLTISGSGAMYDYESLSDVPWGDLATRGEIESIVVEEGVTHIGNYAFQRSGNVTSVTLPDTLESIGERGFDSCLSLESITIPSNVTSIGFHAFYTCSDLKEIRFTGDAPAINSDVFYGVTADAYYPGGNTTWTSSKLQDYGGTLTWHGYGNIENMTVKLAYTTATYTGVSKRPAVTINGLKENTDFTVYYSNNLNAGKATVTVKGIGNYTGTVTKTFTIKKANTENVKVTLSATSFVYNGKYRKPTVTVKFKNGIAINSLDYALTYSGGRNVGKYSVKISFRNNISGTITKYYTVKPKGTSISSLTKASKAFTVKWKKQSTKMSATRITGYQIQYSTSKTFSSNVKSKLVSGYSNTSKKITGLSSKKTYYVRIRTYKTVSGTKYYSAWSAVKSVKTK